ncbi:MAG: hypothetical protein LUC90_00975 [Lachnospiraceae bacterium]|nr:hypothetical protein [Lachnospiraceae bacterium]
MVEYNKIFAAHLERLPGLKAGVVESNGSQNYQNWEKMCQESPAWGKSWAEAEDGMFYLDEEYYASDGGIWQIGGEK